MMDKIEKMMEYYNKELNWNPPFAEALSKHSPDALKGYMMMRDSVQNGKLPKKTRELLFTILDSIDEETDGAKAHSVAAIEAGLTVEELVEAFVIVTMMKGINVMCKSGVEVINAAEEAAKRKRHRVQAIIIQDKKVLLGYGCIDKKSGKMGHSFIGGGVEDGESEEEAIIREIREEANINGEIIFKLKNGKLDKHTTFFVDIGDQQPVLGYDPEEENMEDEKKALQGLKYVSLKEKNQFTKIDIEYFKILIDEIKNKDNYRELYDELSLVVGNSEC